MWVKICGITVPEDIHAAASADAIGLNFYKLSKRYVAPNTAAELARLARPGQEIVGVFVNSSLSRVIETADLAGLTAVQFHGDESPAAVAEFQRQRPDLKIIRAFRIGNDGVGSVNEWLQDLAEQNVNLAGLLVDAFVAGEYGGTGHRIDPAFLEARQDWWPPLILAGGLTPETVQQSIAAVQPWGVDTASGVEDTPGRKNHDRVSRFVSLARKQ